MRNLIALKHQQKGFTLIELIIVIVIIGILAAVAVPKFVSLTSDAQDGVAKGIAGSLASASATNFAAAQGGLTHTAATDCATLAGLIDMPLGYTPSGTLNTNGTQASCSIKKPDGSSFVTAANIYGAP